MITRPGLTSTERASLEQRTSRSESELKSEEIRALDILFVPTSLFRWGNRMDREGNFEGYNFVKHAAICTGTYVGEAARFVGYLYLGTSFYNSL